jgi:hypothetical protein
MRVLVSAVCGLALWASPALAQQPMFLNQTGATVDISATAGSCPCLDASGNDNACWSYKGLGYNSSARYNPIGRQDGRCIFNIMVHDFDPGIKAYQYQCEVTSVVGTNATVYLRRTCTFQ